MMERREKKTIGTIDGSKDGDKKERRKRLADMQRGIR